MEATNQFSLNKGENKESMPQEIDKLPHKDFNIKSVDNIEFILNIYKGKEEIIFIAKQINNLNEINYKKIAQLKEFEKAKRYFRQYENSDELFTDFFEILKENEINIKFKDKILTVGFQFETKSKKDIIMFEFQAEKERSNNIENNICKEVDISRNKLDIETLKNEEKYLNWPYKDTIFNTIKLLLTSKTVILQNKFKIIDIKEIEYNEYCLSLESDENIYNGFFIKTEENLIINQIIKECIITLLKKESQLRIYIIQKNNDWNIEQNKNIINTNLDKITYNLLPDNLTNIFINMAHLNIEVKEKIFFILESCNNITKLISPIDLEYYSISSKFIDENQDMKKNDFLYVKNFFLEKEKKEINCNNLSILKKANDYEIFNTLEKNLREESLDFLPNFEIITDIRISEKIQINCLISKVVLKSPQNKLIIISDIYNRLIKIEYNLFKYLELFDLLLIVNCSIKKSKDSDYLYDLILSNNSIKYSTKKLFFDKRLYLNNFTILNIHFPDFNEKYNYYDTLYIDDYKIKTIKKNILCVVKFDNEKCNEIVPYKIECENEKNKNIFKFFIVHNLMFNINIFLNNRSENNCCIEYCYYDCKNDVPLTYKINLGIKKYIISHSNSFDSLNRIGFVLANIPPNNDISKIKTNKEYPNISSQIWLCPLEDLTTGKKEYFINQILNINEANIKIYYPYELKKEYFSIFNDFHKNFQKFDKNWKKKSNNIINYFEDINQKVENSKEKGLKEQIDRLIFEDKNIDYDPNSLDYSSFKTYINISLYSSLNKIKEKNTDFITEWKKFLDDYNNLVNELYILENKLTYHQKIRVLNKLILYYFNDKERSGHICKFFFIDENNIDENNSYYLALKFNRNIIKRLTEKSKLTQGFLQSDGFILKNYFTDGEKVSYSLTNEPLILMKHHLLSNYENIVFIIYENPYNNLDRKASQDKKNNITLINEKSLFNEKDSETLIGKDNALPISMEFFHEKDSHSKKNLKNLYIDSPLYCYKDNQIEVLSEAEDGRFIESIIGDNDFILELKNPKNKLGALMKEEYFIGENFKQLYNR